MKAYGTLLPAALFALTAALAGCGEDQIIEIRYDRPAVYDVSAHVKRVAVAEFGGQTAEDKRWGEVASDKLVSLLDQTNRKFRRYELVDRKGLKAVMDERDLRLAISDTDSAGKVGKLANVQAIIYGNVTAMHRDEHLTRQTFDISSRSMKTVPYVRRVCQATLNFTMVDVDTGKTIATLTPRRDYDSDKQTKGGAAAFTKALGVGGDDTAAIDSTIDGMIDACVQEFVGKISPHEEAFKIALESGKSKFVDKGNSLAVEREYKDALAQYRKGISDQPKDAGALFNAGLMCEATGDFKSAEEYYAKALDLRDGEKKFIQARRRVRLETDTAGSGKASGE